LTGSTGKNGSNGGNGKNAYSRSVLYTLLFTNLVSLLIGAGFG